MASIQLLLSTLGLGLDAEPWRSHPAMALRGSIRPPGRPVPSRAWGCGAHHRVLPAPPGKSVPRSRDARHLPFRTGASRPAQPVTGDPRGLHATDPPNAAAPRPGRGGVADRVDAVNLVSLSTLPFPDRLPNRVRSRRRGWDIRQAQGPASSDSCRCVTTAYLLSHVLRIAPTRE